MSPFLRALIRDRRPRKPPAVADRAQHSPVPPLIRWPTGGAQVGTPPPSVVIEIFFRHGLTVLRADVSMRRCVDSFLDASKNWLTTVPRNLCRCTKLVTVLLNQNRITQASRSTSARLTFLKEHTLDAVISWWIEGRSLVLGKGQ